MLQNQIKLSINHFIGFCSKHATLAYTVQKLQCVEDGFHIINYEIENVQLKL